MSLEFALKLSWTKILYQIIIVEDKRGVWVFFTLFSLLLYMSDIFHSKKCFKDVERKCVQ